MSSIRSLRIPLAVALAALGAACADVNGPSEPSLSRGPLGNVLGNLTGFITCSPRPERVDTFVVTSRGGSFKVDYAEVRIPKNALPGGVSRTFEMRTPSSTIHSVIFTPIDGLGQMVFTDDAVVRFTYGNCLVPKGHGAKVVYTTDDNDPQTGLPRIISDIPSLDIPLLQAVKGKAHHFSRYAVNY